MLKLPSFTVVVYLFRPSPFQVPTILVVTLFLLRSVQSLRLFVSEPSFLRAFSSACFTLRRFCPRPSTELSRPPVCTFLVAYLGDERVYGDVRGLRPNSNSKGVMFTGGSDGSGSVHFFNHAGATYSPTDRTTTCTIQRLFLASNRLISLYLRALGYDPPLHTGRRSPPIGKGGGKRYSQTPTSLVASGGMYPREKSVHQSARALSLWMSRV